MLSAISRARNRILKERKTPVPVPRLHHHPSLPASKTERRRAERVRVVRSRMLAIICAAPYPRRGFIKTLITGVHACVHVRSGVYVRRGTTQRAPRVACSPYPLRELPRRCSRSRVQRARQRELWHAPDIYLQGCTSRLRCQT